MNSQTPSKDKYESKSAAGILAVSAVFVFSLGVLVLYGWHTHNIVLVKISDDFVPMAYNTGVCFMLCGAGLLFAASPRLKMLGSICGAIVAICGAMTVLQYSSGVDFGFDHILMKSAFGGESGYQFKMALNTALCFLVVGVMILYAAIGPRAKYRDLTIAIGGSIIAGLGTDAFFGYVTGVKIIYGNGSSIPMAVHTAVGSTVLGLGLIAMAWRDTRRGTLEPPSWLPVVFFSAGIVSTLGLWRAVDAVESSATINSHLPETVLFIGTMLSFLIAAVFHFGLKLRRSLKKLEDAEEYHRLFEHSNDPILIFDPYTEIVFDVNERACVVYGLSRQDFVGASLKKISKDVRRGENELAQLLATHVPRSFESVQFRSDGVPINFLITISLIEYRGVRSVLSVHHDQTESKQVQIDLAEREEYLRSLLRSAQDAIISGDDQGNIISWNGGAEKIFGYTEGEVLGQPFLMLIPEDSRHERRLALRRFLEFGESKLVGQVSELTGLKKDGTQFPSELSLGIGETSQGRFFTGIVRDISERRSAQDKVKKNLALLTATLQATADGILAVSLDDEILICNEKFTQMWGGGPPQDGSYDGHLRILKAHMMKQLKNPDVLAAEIARSEIQPDYTSCHRLELTDGRIVERFTQPSEIDGEIVGRVISFRDITARCQAEEQLIHDAFHDNLTGLANRALFKDHLRLAVERGKNNPHKLYSVLYLDLDRFKFVNDSMGHLAGDQILRFVARRLESVVRSGDLIARLGGDEFAILLTDIAHPSESLSMAESILSALKKPFQIEGREFFVSSSIGIAISGGKRTNAENMLRDADMAMYKAKRNGKACYRIYDQAMHEIASRELQIETDIRLALNRGEFCLYYQPIVNLSNRTLVGFEALMRWDHPDRGIIPPDEFIPIAEENGMILRLGEWAMREACHQLRTWQELERGAGQLMMSVNVSCREFMQKDLADRIAESLAASRLFPGCLKVEITESHLMQDADLAINTLQKLRMMGVETSLDDFGTGYSSLSHLHRLCVGYLKIDRSFVANMTNDHQNFEIVRTIIKLAHNLKMKVIAEGIETPEHLEYLTNLECEFGQGYLFSKPLPAKAAREFIALNYEKRLTLLQDLVPTRIKSN